MKRKTLAVITTAALLAFLFTGCSSDNNEEIVSSTYLSQTENSQIIQDENNQLENQSEENGSTDISSEAKISGDNNDNDPASADIQTDPIFVEYPDEISSASNVTTSSPSGGASAESGGSQNNSIATSSDSEKEDGQFSDSRPTQSTDTHTHNFVDAGVQALDWSNTPEPGYTGPTNTREAVSAVNVCLGCGLYLGKDSDLFSTRYYEHIFGPNASDCGGAYTAATVYACYHLLSCSDPDCHCYRRGEFAYYEYTVYLDGNQNPGTVFILEDWQIEELGLPKL